MTVAKNEIAYAEHGLTTNSKIIKTIKERIRYNLDIGDRSRLCIRTNEISTRNK